MDPSAAGLNAAQYTAVTSPSSVLQILAPPGSGKTKTLTSRVAYLLSHYGYKPWNILCLTFTIKSAREMKERIAKLIGNGMEARLILGTFHSVCRRYLVTYGHLIHLRKGFGIADSSDSLNIIKRVIKRMNLKIDPRKAQSRISSSKSRGIAYAEVVKEEAKKRRKDVDQQEFLLVYEAYENQLEKSNLLDYDDLLLRCVELLRYHPECVSNVEVVLIDEFQDTNLVQFDLMREFAWKNKRITTVGDPDQSIYGWRSAEAENINRMQDLYEDTLVIHLEENYRSSGAIILSAREVIEQDVSRIPHPLIPTHCPGTAPVLRRVPTAEAEALWIVSEIQRCAALTGNLLKYSDHAVLLRSAALSRHIESAMGRAGIPYRMVGGQRFFDRVEIKILLDYLRVISQPKNNDALARIINTPSRGIGPATVKTLLETAETGRTSLWYLIRTIIQGAGPRIKISKQAQQGLGSLIHLVSLAMRRLADVRDPYSPELLLRHIAQKLQFEIYLKKAYEQDYDTRWANVEELFAQASDYQISIPNTIAQDDADYESLPVIEGIEQAQGSPAEEALSKFLANVALATEVQRVEEDEDGVAVPQHRVTLSTMHAAKGLEWPVVFIPSAYEGSIPHSRAEDTDEERRLLYVAMTRAQALLYISCPTKNSQREETALSSFLSSKKIRHFFSNRGPSLGFSAVQDISRILRRECPTDWALLESSKALASLEDNALPLDGSGNAREAGSRWNNSPASDQLADFATPSAKRRRVHADYTEDADSMLTGLGKMPIPATFSTSCPVTMQNPSMFSYHRGFTTASAQLQVKEGETTLSRLEKGRARAVDLTRQQSTSPKKEPPQKCLHGQSTLSHFLARKSASAVSSAPPGLNTLNPSATIASTEVGIAAAAQFKSAHLALPEATSASLASAAVLNQIPQRKPLGSIPQSLATHRFQQHPTTRPRLPRTCDEDSTKDYVFFSSSPPQSTSLSKPKGEVASEDPMLNRTVRGSAVKSAKTYHTTSMAQVQSSNNGSRRTLGVKRSMNGWAARGSKEFAVPRSIDKGG